MDRLPAVTVTALLAAAWGCERSGDEPPPRSTERVNAVAAKPKKERPLAELCDVMPDGDAASDGGPLREFAYPTFTEDSAEPADGGWRWVNLWATWCKPCIEEMPMLRTWADRLSVELVFVSVDESEEDLASYKREHPDTPTAHRMANLDALPDWLVSVGLDRGATIPVHIVVDPDDRVRCVRSGSVSEEDYALAERLLSKLR